MTIRIGFLKRVFNVFRNYWNPFCIEPQSVQQYSPSFITPPRSCPQSGARWIGGGFASSDVPLVDVPPLLAVDDSPANDVTAWSCPWWWWWWSDVVAVWSCENKFVRMSCMLKFYSGFRKRGNGLEIILELQVAFVICYWNWWWIIMYIFDGEKRGEKMLDVVQMNKEIN